MWFLTCASFSILQYLGLIFRIAGTTGSSRAFHPEFQRSSLLLFDNSHGIISSLAVSEICCSPPPPSTQKKENVFSAQRLGTHKSREKWGCRMWCYSILVTATSLPVCPIKGQDLNFKFSNQANRFTCDSSIKI